jgi:hypothetical protein
MIGTTRTESGCASVWIGGDRTRIGFWYRLHGVKGLLRVLQFTSGRVVVRLWRFAFCRTANAAGQPPEAHKETV